MGVHQATGANWGKRDIYVVPKRSPLIACHVTLWSRNLVHMLEVNSSPGKNPDHVPPYAALRGTVTLVVSASNAEPKAITRKHQTHLIQAAF